MGKVLSTPACIMCAMLLAGCTASSVNTRDPSTKKYAPVGEKVDGEVSYCDAGAKFVRNARREDAYKKMYETCNGSYEIVREEDSARGAICNPQHRIWFKCVTPASS